MHADSDRKALPLAFVPHHSFCADTIPTSAHRTISGLLDEHYTIGADVVQCMGARSWSAAGNFETGLSNPLVNAASNDWCGLDGDGC